MAKNSSWSPVGTVYRRNPDPEVPVWGWIIVIVIGLGLLGQCAG